ncbi:hypothetical protein F5Y16DRAFT_23037 [Xylariaceae sp. FL0255]|nr:hypothetical protein F5Y16DRAFT_23037 [Xylariaceae sp. FL0255]
MVDVTYHQCKNTMPPMSARDPLHSLPSRKGAHPRSTHSISSNTSRIAHIPRSRARTLCNRINNRKVSSTAVLLRSTSLARLVAVIHGDRVPQRRHKPITTYTLRPRPRARESGPRGTHRPKAVVRTQIDVDGARVGLHGGSLCRSVDAGVTVAVATKESDRVIVGSAVPPVEYCVDTALLADTLAGVEKHENEVDTGVARPPFCSMGAYPGIRGISQPISLGLA